MLLIRRPEGSKKGIVREIPMGVFGTKTAREYIAAGLLGKTFSRSSLRKAWYRGVRRVMEAGEIPVPRKGHIRPYDLRHKRGGDLRRAGADLADVGAYLGHKPGSKTTARYSQTVPEKIFAAVDRAELAEGAGLAGSAGESGK